MSRTIRVPRWYDDYEEEPYVLVMEDQPPRRTRGRRKVADVIKEFEETLRDMKDFEKRMKGPEAPKPPQMHPVSQFLLMTCLSTGLAIIINLMILPPLLK